MMPRAPPPKSANRSASTTLPGLRTSQKTPFASSCSIAERTDRPRARPYPWRAASIACRSTPPPRCRTTSAQGLLTAKHPREAPEIDGHRQAARRDARAVTSCAADTARIAASDDRYEAARTGHRLRRDRSEAQVVAEQLTNLVVADLHLLILGYLEDVAGPAIGQAAQDITSGHFRRGQFALD